MKRRLWTREELIVALNLYLKLPFGKIHHSNPEIIKLSKLIDRTPSSVSMRLSNFASVDPYHQKRGIKGLKGGINQVQPIWDEFISDKEELIFESESILAKLENTTFEKKYQDLLWSIPEDIKGKTRIQEVKVRINQNVFRDIVLANYSGKCAITGIDVRELLIASHIVPWSRNKKERLNPENGICLSALYDVAFDRGLIGVNKNYQIILSSQLKENVSKNYFATYFGFLTKSKLQIPQKYLPKKEFLEYHLDTIFKG